MNSIQSNQLKKHFLWSGFLLLCLSLLLVGVALATPEETYLSAGGNHTCAIETDGDVVCWGGNEFGQSNVPAGSGPFSQVSAGGGYTCGLETDGDVVCWGFNEGGIFDIPSGFGPFSQVSAGGGHICGVETDGDVVCWGFNNWGETDVPAGSGPFSQVSAGYGHTCAVETDGDVICWGDDRGGQVSQGNNLNAGPFSQVSSGDFHSCAVEIDGDVICWGDISTGPRPPRPGYSQVSVGIFQVCGLKTDGQVVCWQKNQTSDLTLPVALDPVSQVSFGAFHTCALETDGDVVCWGENEFGQTDVPADSGPFGPPPPNTAPTAVAGGPYSVVEGGSVQLDAAGSGDAEQDPATLSYAWDFDGDGQYDDATGSAPTFSAAGLEAPATVTVGLQVTDDGGLSTTASASVTVIYNFTGFFAPIDNLPTVNQAKGGQAIPVKFSLNGDQGLDIFAGGYPASQEIACDGSAPVNEVEETGTAGNSGLSYDSDVDQYSYKWKTDKGWSGTCRQLIVRFDDGSEHTALFQFK